MAKKWLKMLLLLLGFFVPSINPAGAQMLVPRTESRVERVYEHRNVTFEGLGEFAFIADRYAPWAGQLGLDVGRHIAGTGEYVATGQVPGGPMVTSKGHQPWQWSTTPTFPGAPAPPYGIPPSERAPQRESYNSGISAAYEYIEEEFRARKERRRAELSDYVKLRYQTEPEFKRGFDEAHDTKKESHMKFLESQARKGGKQCGQ